MGAGNSTAQPIPKPPPSPTAVDQTDVLLKQRMAAMRTLALRQGLQSTSLTTPAPGSLLGAPKAPAVSSSTSLLGGVS